MKFDNSNKAFNEALKYIPGGVNSPVRAFKSVNRYPIFVKCANGSKVYDEDDNEYIDYIGSWGPMILGHNNEMLRKALIEASYQGLSYGLPTVIETSLAKTICKAYPSCQNVRMVNSGSEATMSAIRVARGYTNKNKIIKFEGCYHGHNDSLLVSAGSGALTFGVPTSPGVPNDIVKNTLVAKYNDIASVKELIEANSNDIAAIILEPIAANMGVIPATKQFLQAIRKLCDENNIVLIFDEVISGFRSSYQGASGVYRINPDMVCFGKIIGGGLPVGAYGGLKEIMEMVSPQGPVYQAGTLSGNPLAMHVGNTMLNYLKEHDEVYEYINEYACKLEKGMKEILDKYQLDYTIHRIGSLLTLFFTNGEIINYDDVKNCSEEIYAIYFNEMLEQGILIAPSQYEAMFISNSLNQEDLAKTLNAFDIALKKVKAWLS